ncbi:tol-pal system protein YbgF [Marinobacterium marinum]|uniref:Cell division coordinator CpoB n=1 Tax=Marinobacterium marinum TaxID=2756129 RepID=A0A7W1WXE9_9GAMM|nr:tol-pal system protein YbgF [Marinobacterium marinum]MBA4502010.1 tol-pal system protein YbgF [Marinobacterium marinum]
MKGSRQLLIAALALSVLNVQAAPVTVVEISEAGTGGGAGAQPRLSAQNEMFFMLQQLQDEVRSLRGTIEQQQYRLDRLESQQRDRYRDMDKRIGLLFQHLPEGAGMSLTEDAGAAASVETGSGRLAASDEVSVSGERAAAPVVPPENASGAQEEQAYNAAFAKVRSRDFAAAEGEFKAFVDRYPESVFQPNAWYWLGEVYMAQQKTAESEAAFNRVVDRFGQHGKAADALYKLGVLAGRSGNTAKARQLMQRVVQEYPQAPAADLARGYLKP